MSSQPHTLPSALHLDLPYVSAKCLSEHHCPCRHMHSSYLLRTKQSAQGVQTQKARPQQEKLCAWLLQAPNVTMLHTSDEPLWSPNTTDLMVDEHAFHEQAQQPHARKRSACGNMIPCSVDAPGRVGLRGSRRSPLP